MLINPQGDQRAACARSPAGMFYPTDTAGWKRAKRVCDGCEIRAACLAWALDRNEQFGVWGGTSERTRRTMRRDAKRPDMR